MKVEITKNKLVFVGNLKGLKWWMLMLRNTNKNGIKVVDIIDRLNSIKPSTRT